MKLTTTTSLMTTMTLFSRADSLVPNTSKVVSAAMIRAAGRLTMPVTELPSASLTTVPGAEASAGGMTMPIFCRMLTTYPD